MELEMREMREEERKYSFVQSPLIMSISGCIGHLCVKEDESDGKAALVWTDHRPYLKSEEFKEEMGEVATLLSEDEKYGRVLEGENNMIIFAATHPEGAFPDAKNCGCRFDTDGHVYLLRIGKEEGGVFSYIFAYRKKWFEGHLEKAKEGVRFIRSDYSELFRIPDGGRVRFTYPDGHVREEVVRYIDSYHIEYPYSAGRSTVHICEDAERREKDGIRVEPAEILIPGERFAEPEFCDKVFEHSGEAR